MAFDFYISFEAKGFWLLACWADDEDSWLVFGPPININILLSSLDDEKYLLMRWLYFTQVSTPRVFILTLKAK